MSVKISEPEQAIRVLTIDRPPVNALNEEVVDMLSTAVNEAIQDQHIKAVIITGSGKVFVAGADVEKLAAADKGAAREIVAGVKALHRMLRTGPKPVIAAINGMAAGGGLELAMACDIRIADKDSLMGLPEVTLGVLPGAGGTQMLPRLVGLGKSLELMLQGRIVTADEAMDIGLIEQVAREESALEKALGLAKKIIQNAPLAIAEIKAAAYDTLSLPLEKGLEEETERFVRLCETEDKNEGIAAFKARRAAVFQGR
jgi:enoyl-CoA hydratase/carnithine racemase